MYTYLTDAKPEAVEIPNSGLEADLVEFGFPRKVKKDILWNFEKFLIDRQGQVVERFAPDVTPDNAIVKRSIEAVLRS